MFAVVANGVQAICHTQRQLDTILALYSYPKFKKFSKEEEAYEWIRQHSRVNYTSCYNQYGDTMGIGFVSVTYSITQLGEGYQQRAVPYMEELSNIKVYLLSQEDLIITKVISNRKKDIGDLLKTNILTKHNVQKAVSVLQAEYPADTAKRYSAYIKHLLARKENADFE